MKRAILSRNPTSDEGTFGHLSFEEHRWATGELPDRANQRGISCINPGVYLCKWAESPTKGWCYHIQDVPGRSNCLIHAANWMGDNQKGWVSQLRGCIAPGLSIGELMNSQGRMQMATLNSRAAICQIVNVLKKEDFELEIVWVGK